MALVSEVLLKFKADTKDAKKKIKGLQGDQKKLAQESLAASEKQNKSLDDQIDRWGKIAVGIGVAVVAIKGMQVAVKEFARRSQLETAAVGANITGIERAAQGLLTEMEALKFAAAAMNTDFAVSQEEMEDVAKWMVILRNQGNDWLQVQKEVTAALVEGKTEGLEKFGVSIRGITPGIDGFRAVLARAKQEVAEVGEVTEVSGDIALKAGVKWQNAIDMLVAAIGRLTVALITLLDEGFGLIEESFRMLKNTFADLAGRDGQGIQAIFRGVTRTAERAIRGARPGLEPGVIQPSSRADLAVRHLAGALADALGLKAPGAPGAPGRGKGGGLIIGGGSGPGGRLTDFGTLQTTTPAGLPGFVGGGGRFGGVPTFTGAGAGGGGVRGGLGGGGRGLLEQLGGPNDAQIEANRMLAASFAQMQDIGVQAFQQLASAGGEMFASMLDGTELVSGGFKAMMGNILHSMSAQMFGLAITEGVMALVELAKGVGGNPKGFAAAAVHGKAAAAAAGAGVAVAGMARAFGGGGQSAGGGALPAAAAGAVGGGAAGGGGSNVTIFVGSDFEENPRGRAQRLKRAFDRAQTLEGDDTIVLPE